MLNETHFHLKKEVLGHWTKDYGSLNTVNLNN